MRNIGQSQHSCPVEVCFSARVSAKKLQREFGCSHETAWRIGHEIRKYMALLHSDGLLDGNVEVDETLSGGKDKERRWGRDAKANKTVVYAMLDHESGEVISQVVPDKQLEHPQAAGRCAGRQGLDRAHRRVAAAG